MIILNVMRAMCESWTWNACYAEDATRMRSYCGDSQHIPHDIIINTCACGCYMLFACVHVRIARVGHTETVVRNGWRSVPVVNVGLASNLESGRSTLELLDCLSNVPHRSR